MNVSLFTTVISSFALLLHKYSSDNCICIGSPSSNRNHANYEKLIGLFVDTVALRIDIANNMTIKDLINHCGETIVNALYNQDLPFEKLVNIIQPERNLNSNPIFQVMLSWINTPHSSFSLDKVSVEKINIKNGVSPMDITIYAWENDGQIEGEIEYNSDILNRESIQRLRDHFIYLTEQLINNTDAEIKSVSLVSEEDRNILESFTQSYALYPKDKTITELFEHQVLLNPDKIAVSYKGEKLTYNELNSKSNQLAYLLRKIGVSHTSPVGIIVNKSIEMIIGILAILKSGGAYVPIDPEYPESRKQFMLEDSGCKFILTQGDLIQDSLSKIQIINLNSKENYKGDNSNLELNPSPRDLAYIMYTSGTTGQPKGSMIPQQAVVRLVCNTNYINITKNDRILLTGAIVFDATTFEIWGALLNGASLYLADKATILNPKDFGEELINNAITILWLTSPLFTQIAEVRTDIFSRLKYLLVGGDVLSAQHINKVRKDNPALKVINGYGPTENTTFSTTFLIEKDYDSNNIPIGRPISNSTAYIFDKNVKYQPIGVIGDLYVGGDGLSLGYLNRDDLNSRSFLKHPFRPEERLYKTGDLARWLPDGTIEFHGREDNQIKIRGFRVELDEIESVISKIDGVIESAIKPIKIQEGDYKLVAFVHIGDKHDFDTKEAERIIKGKLPPYMIPSAYCFMDNFPKTINGKIDRKALKFDINDFEKPEKADSEPKTEIERILYEIWAESLKTRNFSVLDNFFDIGGNSILTIGIASKIENIFGIEFNIRNIFSAPRIREIAEMIDIKINTIKNINKVYSTQIVEGEI